MTEAPIEVAVASWRRRLYLGMALAAALAVLAIPVGPWLVREAPLDDPDAILSLGSHEHERFPGTARQAARWPDVPVLLTQPRVVTRYNCDACAERIQWLVSLGVERERIVVLQPPVLNTVGELRVAAAWMRAQGRRRLQVVTSPYHTRRARTLAGLLDGDAVVVGVVASPSADHLSSPWWLSRYGRWYVTYELLALANAWWRDGAEPWHLPHARGNTEVTSLPKQPG